MKDTEIIYINEQHQIIIDSHIKNIKALMYFATEKVSTGRYQDFLDILNSIYLYSNNFYNTMLDKNDTDDGVIAEFIFLIPNMTFYTAIGFLTALKDGDNESDIRESLENIGFRCENTTSELADILIDENEKKQMIKNLTEIQVTQN